VGQDISFELDLIENYNSSVYLFDPSPTGVSTMNKYKSQYRLYYNEIGLSENDGYFSFFTPKDAKEGSYTINNSAGGEDQQNFYCKKLTSIAAQNNHKLIDILKIDIEGSEYGVINDICNSDLVIRQICVEFHHFFKDISRIKTFLAIVKLYRKGYRLVHKIGTDYTFILLSTSDNLRNVKSDIF